jgi:hypothetical protein
MHNRGVAMWALSLAVVALVAAPSAAKAQARAQEAVVVATTAPAVRQGQLVRAGDLIDAPAGAVVTLLEANGRLLTVRGRTVYAPASARTAPGADMSKIMSAVAALLRTDRTDVEMVAFRQTGAMAGCPDAAERPPLASLAGLMAANCHDAARAAIAAAAAAASPAALTVANVRALPLDGRALGVVEFVAQANFPADINCSVRSDGGGLSALALGPKGEAALRTPANTPSTVRARPALSRGPDPKQAELVCAATEPTSAAPIRRRAESRSAIPL